MCTKLNSKEVEQMLEGVSGVPKEKFSPHLFVQKLCERVVHFYYNLNKTVPLEFQLSEERVFWNAFDVVSRAALVTLECENDKIFLYALDPMELLRLDKDGKDVLWRDLRSWVKDKYGFELLIGKYEHVIHQGSIPIYSDTKEYLWHTWQMVYDDAMTFEDAFLGED